MDPLSIAASCIGITAGIVALTDCIASFVSSVREARKDLDAVRRELSSLQLSLAALSDEDERFGFDSTPQLKENLLGVLGNCGSIVREIGAVLGGMEGEMGKESSGKLNMGKKLKWATSGKGEMAKLRSGLEAHKSALDIALDLIAISITADIKQDTSVLREDTGKIKEDTDQILQEIENLQDQVAKLGVSHDRGFMMKRFLESSVTYAESVANLDDFEHEDDGSYEVFEKPSLGAATKLTPQPSGHTQRTPSPGQAESDHTERVLSPSMRSQNNYWSSLPQSERDSLLLEAAQCGNPKRLSLLLDSGANIDARNDREDTSLCMAIKHEHYSCLQLLLDNGARTDGIDSRPTSQAFYKAYHLGDLRAMKMIMDSVPEDSAFQISYNGIINRRGKPSNDAIALYNFEPRVNWEITLKKGAAVYDVRHAFNGTVDGFSAGWCEGRFGIFPSYYVQLVDTSDYQSLKFEAREWKTRTENFCHKAKFLRLNTGEVHLLKEDGVRMGIPIGELSFADLQYVNQQAGLNLENEMRKCGLQLEKEMTEAKAADDAKAPLMSNLKPKRTELSHPAPLHARDYAAHSRQKSQEEIENDSSLSWMKGSNSHERTIPEKGKKKRSGPKQSHDSKGVLGWMAGAKPKKASLSKYQTTRFPYDVD